MLPYRFKLPSCQIPETDATKFGPSCFPYQSYEKGTCNSCRSFRASSSMPSIREIILSWLLIAILY